MKQKKSAPALLVWQHRMAQSLLYILAFAVPLFFSRAVWFPFTSSKSFFIIGITSVVLGLWSWGILVRPEKQSVRWTILHITLFLWLGVLTVSACFGVDPTRSFFGGFIQGTSLMLLYVLTAFALVTAWFVRHSERFRERFISAFFWGGVLSAIVLFFSPSVPLMRDGGTFGNSSYAGGYLLIGACIGIYTVSRARTLWRKIIHGLGLLTIILSPIFLNHRVLGISARDLVASPFQILGDANAAAIGFVLSVIVIGLVLLASARARLWKVLGSVGFVLVMASLVYGGSMFLTSDSSLHQTYVTEKTGNRFLFWDIANRGFVERPLLGYGYNNYSYLYQQYFSPVVFGEGYAEELRVNEPHNVVYEYLSTSGIIGLIAYVGLFGVLFLSLFRVVVKHTDDRVLATMLMGALVGYFVQNLFGFDTPGTYFAFFVIIALTLSLQRSVLGERQVSRSVSVISAAALLLASVGIGIGGAILPWRESHQWRSYNAVLQGAKPYPQSISWVGDSDDVTFFAGNLYSLFERSVSSDTATRDKRIWEIIDRQTQFVQQDLDSYPSVYYNHITVGRFLQLPALGHRDGASESLLVSKMYLEKAQKASPLNPQAYLLLAQTYLYMGDTERMLSYLRAALALAPQYEVARTFAGEVMQITPNTPLQTMLDRTID